VTPPASAQPGQERSVTFTVTNGGAGPARGPWTDSIVLLPPAGSGLAEVLAAQVTRTADLAPGASYTATATFNWPDTADGAWTVQLRSDAFGQVFEAGAEANNILSAATTTAVTHPDLSPTAVSVAATGVSGTPLSVDWTNRNLGTAAISGPWSNRLFLSRDALLDGADRFLGDATGPALAAGASQAASATFTLPEDATGDWFVLVQADPFSQVRETGAEGNNVSASGLISLTLPPLPDLLVQNVTITAPGGLESGKEAVVGWSIRNSGASAAGSFFDRVVVVNTTTGQTVYDNVHFRDAALLGTLGVNASAAREARFLLPQGTPGVGALSVTITTDYYGQIREGLAGSVAETNNGGAGAGTSIRAAVADLQAQGLTITSGTPVSGETLTIAWTAQNAGAVAAPATTERLIVTNLTTGAVLADRSLSLAALAAGGTLARSQTVTLPDGTAGVGQIQVRVISDAGSAVFEETAGEGNNTATGLVTSTLATYPDLTITSISAPPNATAGQTVTVTWTVQNLGNRAAQGAWTERLLLSVDGALGDDQLLASVFVTDQDIAAGASVTRSAQVTLPVFAEGARRVIAQTDAAAVLFESNEANNTTVDDGTISIGGALTFAVLPTTISEDGGTSAATGQVTRSGSLAAPLVVTLSSGSPEVILPATVTILAGQSSASFAVGVVGNTLVEGSRTATLTAAATGMAAATSQLTITDNDVNALTVTLPFVTATEGAAEFLGTVSRTSDTTGPLVVNLTLDKAYKAVIPATVTIAAGQRDATFAIRLVDDTLAEGTRNLRFTATAAGHVNGSAELTAYDDDIPTLSLQLGSAAVSEGDPAGNTLTITRDLVSDQPIDVLLRADAGQLRLPSKVTIAGGQASVTVNIAVADNALVDGARIVVIRADVADSVLGVAVPTTAVQTGMTILDDDGATLTMSLNTALIAEDGTATGTVTRNTPTTGDLVVSLVSSDPTEATLPATVTILAGQTSATFTVSGVNDGTTDGTRPVTLLAQATDFNSGAAGLSVTDRDIADLQVTAISLPPMARTGQTVAVQFTVRNSGFGVTDGSWKDRVYVSADAVLDQNDVLVQTLDSTPLGIGESYTRTASFVAGNRSGPAYVIVVSDPEQALSELLDNNNERAAELNIAAAYRATVETATEVAPAGLPVTLTGTATSNITGAPQANSLVTVQVRTGETIRTLSTFTNALGQFSTVFTPLAGEGGRYTISADHPGVTDRLPQDSFVLVGLRSETLNPTIQVTPGTPTTGTITLRNLADIPQTGLSVAVGNVPPVLNVTVTAPPVIEADGTITLNYTATSTSTANLTGRVTFVVTTAEGSVLNIPVTVSVTPLAPLLVANPGYLEAGMLRGTQKLIEFEVVNTGGAATGPLTLTLPNEPWLRPGNGTSFASLGAGERMRVSLLLNPAADLPLALYNGGIVLTGTNSSVSVNYQFRAISDAVGDVVLNIQDEYTFYADGNPPLEGATATLFDPYTNHIVATGVSGADGQVRFFGVAEGIYQLRVSADKHDGVSGAFQVNAGVTNSQDIFLHRQVVSYKWTVVPVEFTDKYKLVLETVFETEVPMPVVTVDEPRLMPIILPGQTTQMQITLRNHGLIAAEQVQVRVPDDPDLIITPLIDYIDILPAQSAVTIPITIRLREGSPLAAQMAAASAEGVRPVSDISALSSDIPLISQGWGNTIAKCLGIDTIYTYECKNGQWVSVPIKLDAVFCGEDIYSAGNSLLEHIADPTKANAANLACDVLGAILQCAGADDCTQAIVATICGVGLGFATGGPAGAGLGALGALDDILACLCGMDFGGGGGETSPPPSLDGFGVSGWATYGTSPGGAWGTSISWDPGGVICGPATSAAGVSDGPSIAIAPNEVCAQVRLKLEQEAVTTRTAFLGTLEMDNGTAGTLSGITLLLDIRDDAGNDANDKFVVLGPDTTVMTRNADGTYNLPPGASGALKFTFIPTTDAAPDAPTRYAIGGTLTYVDGGNAVSVPLLSNRITVYPEAKLQLDYFWQRDVKGDDPFTEGVEPSETFALGLQVANIGKGAARNLQIASAQPQIIENEKGLLVDFKIVSSQVGNQEGTPSLSINLGNIDPGNTVTGQWNMLSTVQGKFIDYKASFVHEDQYGGFRTSLIDSVNIHELIRAVNVTHPTQDGIPDYLANDVADPDHNPDTLWLSTGGQVPVSLATNTRTEPAAGSLTLLADVQAGWTYIKVADPHPGMELLSITRSDGKVIPLAGMSWRTDRTFRPGEPGATNENLLHLIDENSTGSYTLVYRVIDTLAPQVTALEQPAALVAAPVGTLDVTFSEDLDPATLTGADLILSRNGVVLDTTGLTVSALGGGVYRFAGLAALTGVDGNYTATVTGSGVTDPNGNAGLGMRSVSWAMSATSMVITSVQAVTDPRNSAVTSLQVAFSRDVDVATFDAADLELTRDGTPLALNSIVVTQLSPSTFRIDGLGSLTGTEGLYALTVRATGILDSTGAAGAGQLTRSWTTDLTGPGAVLDTVVTNPRNIVVPQLGVTFSEDIDVTSFTLADLTLTRNGGANLINPAEVTIEAVDATHYLIKGINWPQGIGGTYVLSLDRAGILDRAGNAGAGVTTSSWVMDITPPPAAYDLRITPDTGSSSTDGRTTETTLSLLGSLNEDGLTVRLRDMTTSTDLGEAVVTGRDFAGAFTLNSLGRHEIRVRTVDVAGNTTDTTYEIFVDVGGPALTGISAVSPAVRTAPVSSVTIDFNGPVAPETLGIEDVTLTRDGAAVDLTGLTFTAGANNGFVIDGLAAKTALSGVYVLSVTGTGVTDAAGNVGTGTRSVTWTRVDALDVGLRGTLYDDSDGDGVRGTLESGRSGVTVFLDADSDGDLDAGEESRTTDAFGAFSFLNLAAGVYRVVSVIDPGQLATGPVTGLRDVTVVAEQVTTGVNFGRFTPGQISGTKFIDADADGVRDAGEAGLSGVTLFVDLDGDQELDAGETTVVTGVDGSYTLTGIGPGIVRVGEVMANGWTRTTPAAAIRITSGLNVSGADVGNAQLVSISGMKFEDTNGNGTRDAGESGLANWRIFIDANADGILQGSEISVLTDADGLYTFASLLPGTYTIAEEQQDGWVQTTPLGSGSGALNTAGSDISIDPEGCGCGTTWSVPDGTSLTLDLGARSTVLARDVTGLTAALQKAPYAGLTGTGIRTVIIDTGIDVDHPFFGEDADGDGVADRIVYQWDFADNDADASDRLGHGSHIATMIGSGDGRYMGVAPDTELIVLKVFKDLGTGTFGFVEKALQWVLANVEAWNIGVVNLSLGDNGNWQDSLPRYGLGDEFAALAGRSVITVAASGNSYNQFNRMGVAYPASDPAVIAVGGTWSGDFGGPWTVATGATDFVTGTDHIAAFSQRGDTLLDIFAPGARFNGANATGGVQTMQGTSQASGFVAGAAALAQQLAWAKLGHGLNTADFATLLRATGDMIFDGDDEVDNVTNTGLSYPRIQFEKLFDAIMLFEGGTSGGGGGTPGGGTGTPGVTTAAPGVHRVTLSTGQTQTGLDFGNYKLADLSGTVFADTDGNGAREADETALAGRIVFLDTDADSVRDAGERFATTDADGTYSFSRVGPGSLSIVQEIPGGWTTTTANPTVVLPLSGGAITIDLGSRTETPNRNPVALADTYVTRPGQVLTVNAANGVLKNDSDPDDNAVLADLVTEAPTYGVVEMLPDGSFTYTPVAGFSGIDSFDYRVSDGAGGTAEATVTINVVNGAPVAQNDSYTLKPGQTLTVLAADGLLKNDSDPDGDIVVDVLVTGQPDHGAVTVQDDGSFTYAPTAGFSGTDSFTYRIDDGFGGFAEAVVTLTVVNRLPVATADRSSTNEDTSALIAVLSNDRDPDGTLPMTVAAGPISALGAAVTVQADGRVLYDPRGSLAIQAQSFGQTVTDTFLYTVTDADGGTASSTVTVLVTGLPDADLSRSVTTDEDTPLQVLFDGITITGISPSAQGAVIGNDSAGLMTYDPRGASKLQALAVGALVSDSFSFTGVTAEGDGVTGVVTVVVTGRNDAPRAGSLTLTTDPATPVEADVLAVARDSEGKTGVTLTSAAVVSARGAAVSIVGGKLVYDPVGSAALTDLLLGEVVVDTVSYTLSDAQGATGTGTLRVIVEGTRIDLSVVSLPAGATDEDTVVSFPISGPWKLLAVNGRTDLGATASLSRGNLIFKPTTLSQFQALRDGESLTDTITFTLASTAPGSVGTIRTGQMQVVVAGRDDGPTTRIDRVTLPENAASSVNPLANDKDQDAGSILTLASVSSVSSQGVALSIVANRVVYDPTGIPALRNLATGETAIDSFTYVVQDETGRTATQSVIVTVIGRNDAPNAVADSASGDEDNLIAINVLGNDTDSESPVLAVKFVPATSRLGAALTINLDGTVNYDPRGAARLQVLPAGATLTDSFTYVVTDENGGTSTGTVTVVVSGRNDAPVAIADAAATNSQTRVTIAVLANDTDPDKPAGLAVTTPGLSTKGAILTVDGRGRVLFDPRGKFAALAAGEQTTDSFLYTATDAGGLTSTATVTVTITGMGGPAALSFSAPPILGAPSRSDGGLPPLLLEARDMVAPVLVLTADLRVDPIPLSEVTPLPQQKRSRARPVVEEVAPENVQIDLAAAFGGATGSGVMPATWWAEFVAPPADPNRSMVVTIPNAA